MGTKIFVIKLKEVIKTAIFAVLGIAIIGFLICMFIPKSDKTALYEPGTYSASIILHNNPVDVEVTVSDRAIEDIQLLNMGETQEVFYPLFDNAAEELAGQVIAEQTVEIEPSGEYAITGSIILDAIEVALEEAKIQ